MALKDNCSIIQQIEKAEESINSTYERLGVLEKKLHKQKLTKEKQNEVETEIEEVRKLLATNKDQLMHLRTHNRKTFIFVAGLFFVIFTLYVIYLLIFGRDF